MLEKLITASVNCSTNVVKSNCPSVFVASFIAYAIGETSTMAKTIHSTPIIIKNSLPIR